MHIVGCVASCTCVWWMYKHWFVLFMFVYVINFISRLIFEPTLGTSERVRHMWEIKDFTFKKSFQPNSTGQKMPSNARKDLARWIPSGRTLGYIIFKSPHFSVAESNLLSR